MGLKTATTNPRGQRECEATNAYGETGERGIGIPDSRWQPRPKGQVSGVPVPKFRLYWGGSEPSKGTFPV